MKTGTIINQYKIISAIGKGGMGEVLFDGKSLLNPLWNDPRYTDLLKRMGLPE